MYGIKSMKVLDSTGKHEILSSVTNDRAMKLSLVTSYGDFPSKRP